MTHATQTGSNYACTTVELALNFLTVLFPSALNFFPTGAGQEAELSTLSAKRGLLLSRQCHGAAGEPAHL